MDEPKIVGLYLFHYLFIAMTSYGLTMYAKHLPVPVIYLCVAAAGFAGAYLAYEMISRIPVLRWLICGMGERRMFADNLIELRKLHHMSQDELADQIHVSRQTLSKYETGESLPDIEKCKKLADVFGVTVDDLISYDKEKFLGLSVPPKGKHIFGMVKVGEKGQIVIPAKARKIFDIHPGDNLIVLGDEGQGIALMKEQSLLDMIWEIRKSNRIQ